MEPYQELHSLFSYLKPLAAVLKRHLLQGSYLCNFDLVKNDSNVGVPRTTNANLEQVSFFSYRLTLKWVLLCISALY